MQTSSIESVPSFGYTLQRDVPFGEACVAPDGEEPHEKTLKFDVYRPYEPPEGSLPAVIYVHGGAYHRGGRMQPPYKLEGAIHSRPEDYARLLASHGYIAFVVEYRLALDNPEPKLKPGEEDTRADIDAYLTKSLMEGTSRARIAMGLEPLDPNNYEHKMYMWKAVMAATEDVKMALDNIIENSHSLNVDPDRIAMGGHSAGGGITLNIGLGMRARLACIFPLSGQDTAFEHDAIAKYENLPPALLVYAQFDEAAQMEELPAILKLVKKADMAFDFAWIPGFPHFYPYNSPALGRDGRRDALGDRIVEFLRKHLSKKKPTKPRRRDGVRCSHMMCLSRIQGYRFVLHLSIAVGAPASSL
ncbi:dienelactone hydrolase [Gracilaria domingensis]|nr:dienelactone hydrolase [Gracilaria domingensis]